MDLRFDIYADGIPPYGEDVRGDMAEIRTLQQGILAVLAEGPGRGVRANVLASLTLNMLTALCELEGKPDAKGILEIIRSNPDTAFTALWMRNNGESSIFEFKMPPAILLQAGKPVPIPCFRHQAGDTPLCEKQATLKAGSILAVLSGGTVQAGKAVGLSRGWGQEMASAYLQAAYQRTRTAEKLTKLLLTAAHSLDQEQAGDDISVLMVRAVKAADFEGCHDV